MSNSNKQMSDSRRNSKLLQIKGFNQTPNKRASRIGQGSTDRFKTKFCHFFGDEIEKCTYGKQCSFAHSFEEINVRLLHYLLPSNQNFDFYITFFKTEWCPFNFDHNKAQCFYAHNF
jgi:hypothetical protein